MFWSSGYFEVARDSFIQAYVQICAHLSQRLGFQQK